MVRRKSGDETWHRLKDWTKGSKEAERLASQVLRYEDFKLLDPSHPLGGPDQGKDLICYNGETEFLIAVSFSKNELSWSKVKQKFKNDFDKLSGQKGFVFFTNQEITVKKREELKKIDKKTEIEIYHLERISQVLNSPSCYGIRLEFLDIEMTKEEQISFINSRDSVLHEISNRIEDVIEENKGSSIPTEELREFQNILNQITGFSSHSFGAGLYNEGHVSKLRVPLNEIKEFKKVLQSIAGNNNINSASIWGNPIDRLTVPINQLKEFQKILEEIIGPRGQHNSMSFLNDHPINRLNVPLQQLKEYEKRLDRIIEKKKELE